MWNGIGFFISFIQKWFFTYETIKFIFKCEQVNKKIENKLNGLKHFKYVVD